MPRLEEFEPVRILGIEDKRCTHIADDRFHISVRVSPTSSVRWHKYFDDALSQDPSKQWRCEGEEVEMECSLSELQGEIDRLKAQINDTNKRYSEYVEEQAQLEFRRDAEVRRHHDELLATVQALRF